MTLDTATLLSGSDIKKTRDGSLGACYAGDRGNSIVGQSVRLLAMLQTRPRAKVKQSSFWSAVNLVFGT
jgi:hypothetical protein